MISFLGNRYYWLGFASAIVLMTVAYVSLIVFSKDNVHPEGLRTLFRHQKDFGEYVEKIKSGSVQPNPKGEYPIPNEMRTLRVTSIWIKDDFIFFLFMPRWPDDASQTIIYDLTGRTIRTQTLLETYPNRVVYHVQHVQGKWYYWQYN